MKEFLSFNVDLLKDRDWLQAWLCFSALGGFGIWLLFGNSIIAFVLALLVVPSIVWVILLVVISKSI